MFTNFSRRMSTEMTGAATKTITKEYQKNGATIIERINIFQNWSKMSRTKKLVLVGYGTLATGSFAARTYSDGKNELVKYRYNQNHSKHKTDWDAVKAGCGEHVFENFMSGMFFPFTVVSDIMPSVVLYLNPEEKHKENN